MKKIKPSGLKSGGVSPIEKEILLLLTDEFLTPKQIAIRRNTSVQAVYKVIKRLQKKGLFDGGLNRVEKSQPTFKPLNQIRLHAQEFNIKILYKGEKYIRIFKSANLINIDGNSIRLYTNSIEVYSGQSFYSEDEQKATADSMKYFTRLFARLEHELKIIILKPRTRNIKLVNAHYAETNNELAKECENKAEKIRIYTNDDGKLWFLLDNSLNLHESEAVHPHTSKQDMQEAVRPFFNDLRDNSPPTLSQIMGVLKEAAETNRETAAGLNIIASYLRKDIDDGKNKELGGYIG